MGEDSSPQEAQPIGEANLVRGSGTRFSPSLEGQPEHGEAPTSSSSSSSSGQARGLTRGPNGDPSPVIRGKVGVGSYEDPGEPKRKGRTKGKTGRPGR